MFVFVQRVETGAGAYSSHCLTSPGAPFTTVKAPGTQSGPITFLYCRGLEREGYTYPAT